MKIIRLIGKIERLKISKLEDSHPELVSEDSAWPPSPTNSVSSNETPEKIAKIAPLKIIGLLISGILTGYGVSGFIWPFVSFATRLPDLAVSAIIFTPFFLLLMLKQFRFFCLGLIVGVIIALSLILAP